MSSDVLSPSEQTIQLNTYLILNGDKLPSPVVTVGGQAVVYWMSVYLARYPSGKEPNVTDMRTIDVDFVSRREAAEIIAKIFNVDIEIQDPFNPPSIAVMSLLDLDTGKVKEENGKLFADEVMGKAPNLVDIIDRPAGFEAGDFEGENLLLNSEPFYVNPDYHGGPSFHPLVRVLNPVACIRSRLANIKGRVKKNRVKEIARIKALLIPAYYFLTEKLENEPFCIARKHIMEFAWIIWNRDNRRIQVENGMPLYELLSSLHRELVAHEDDYELPPDFIHKELPELIRRREEQYQRLSRC